MSSNEFVCPKCGERAIPIRIDHKPNKGLFIITQKCLKHKTKIRINEKEIETYLDYLFESTFICPECRARYPDYYGIEDIVGIRKNLFSIPLYLILKKHCNICKKNTKLEFSNFLNVSYYDNYYNYLKSQNTPESLEKYKDLILCSKCNLRIIIDNVNVKKGEGLIKGKCIGQPSHKIKYKLPLNEQYNWLSFLPKAIKICKKCDSTDLFRKKTDFKYGRSWGFYYPVKRRIIVNNCNNCGNENTTIMHQGLYEIYRRILKEKTYAPSVKIVLICPECGSEALLEKIQLHPQDIRAFLYCKQNHRSIVILPEQEKSQWIGLILSGIKICINCWSPNQRIWIIIHHGVRGTYIRKSKITLQCLDCGNKRSITINNIVYDEVMDFLFS